MLYDDSIWRDPEHGYRKFIDAADFADFYLFNNLAKNNDRPAPQYLSLAIIAGWQTATWTDMGISTGRATSGAARPRAASCTRHANSGLTVCFKILTSCSCM